MNETTCYYFINVSENIYTHLKEISTEVQIPDYNYKQGPFGNDLNMSVKVSKKKYEIKNDELQLILLERNETDKFEKLKDGPICLKNIPCELVIGTNKAADEDYYAVIVKFSEEHQKMYFLSNANVKSLKHRNLKCEFERRKDIIIDDEDTEMEDE